MTSPRQRLVKPYQVFWAVTALGVVTDLLTKSLVFRWLEFPGGRSVTLIHGVLELRCTTNQGGVFGILQNSGIVFIPLSLVAVGIVFWFYRSVPSPTCKALVPLSLILAGTLGNLCDRVFHGDQLFRGSVRDFIDVHAGKYSWPTFNLADTWICVGAGALLFLLLTDRELFAPPPREAKD